MCLPDSSLAAVAPPAVSTKVPAASTSVRRSRTLRWIIGVLCSLNFAVFWAVPIVVQGQAFHLGLKYVLRPVYNLLDQSPALRGFATRYIYSKPQYSDFFATALLTLLSSTAAFAAVLRSQLLYGSIPWQLHVAYNFVWVGFGGRVMGAAYTFAHKEGHNALLYQRWWRKSVGNVFECWVGLLFGNVPYNFTTSHNHMHHALDGGKGDSLYCWDFDRTSLSDFMVYQERALRHMAGTSSLHYFKLRGMEEQYRLLRKGMLTYWLFTPLALGLLTRSPWFLFAIWLQPLLAMSFFLALINWGYHAYIELDGNGKHLAVVNSLTILDGQDDSFGEDDHMAHHYSTQTWYTQTHTYRARVMEDLKRHHGSVFKEVSIVELSALTLFGQFDRIAQRHYVDFTGKLSQAEIAAMLRRRAQNKEMSCDEYLDWQRDVDAQLLASKGKAE